ncbi:MAG: putative Na+/H+ antiporter [Akkermansia sp.]|nr:putative Na+/H+ antiporter [Akkermansia sp.]
MRKWLIGTFIWCSMVLLGSVHAQEEVVSEVVTLPEPACTSHGANAVPTVEELRAEAEAKDALIKSLNLCAHAQNALMIAAESMSLEALQQYLAQEHHAYDGHTVLEHAAMKVKFALPMTRKPCPECGKTVYHADPDGQLAAWTHHYTNGKLQYSRFPIPLQIYSKGEEGMGLWDKLVHRVKVDNFNLAATIIFLLAILHTFMAPMFQKWAHHMEKAHKQKLRDAKFRILHPEQRMPVSFGSTLCHFLGEVEVVFGLWIIPFAFVCQHYYSMDDFLRYIDHDTSFTEPLFVAVIMVIASSRPIYRLAENTLKFAASMGGSTPAAWWLSVLCIAPLLGSFITEPAAMTLAAILLAKKFYHLKPAPSLCYATLALLFVNVSVGGTLTHFAAPPIVMVAGKWNWDMGHMFIHFGWKAIVGIIIANVIYFLIFTKEFKRLAEVQRANSAFDTAVPTSWEDRQDVIPVWVYAVSIFFLVWTVYFAHHPAIFVGGFLFFLGFTMATPQYQNAFSIKVPLLVAFFLAGLLILGGVQGWWMQPVLQALADLGATATMGLASILTAFNDNASVTFLSSTVPNLPDHIRYAIVAGAVTGGGLTVIANAPNPAGQAILGKYFKDGISALQLFLWAALPTFIIFCLYNFIYFGD